MRTVDAVLIAGPTASGKSALALKLARDHGGAVINADAMQVYRELRVLSARPDASEERQAPHYLYGFASAFEPFSVGLWLEAAKDAIADARAKGLLPIVTGGTGLYFAALLNGLSPIPDIHASIRVEARQKLSEIGNERFHAELAARDPVMGARLNAGDSQRMVRAWEVIEATGQSLAEWQMLKGTPVLTGELARYVLKPNRDWLIARIARRFAAMMANGRIGGSARVARRRFVARVAVGARARRAATDGASGRPIDVWSRRSSKPIAQTRQYAKRQTTWFRHQMPDWTVIERSDVGEMADIVSQALD